MNWNNKREVLKAVKEDCGALEYASEALRNDKEFVLEVVKANRRALQYASEALQNDPEFLESLKRK